MQTRGRGTGRRSGYAAGHAGNTVEGDEEVGVVEADVDDARVDGGGRWGRKPDHRSGKRKQQQQPTGKATGIERSDGHRRKGPVQASSTMNKGAATTTMARCIGGEECNRHYDGCAEGRAQPAA